MLSEFVRFSEFLFDSFMREGRQARMLEGKMQGCLSSITRVRPVSDVRPGVTSELRASEVGSVVNSAEEKKKWSSRTR